MRALACILFAFTIVVSQAAAQSPFLTGQEETESAANTQGLDALIDIIEADPAGAALLARVRASALADLQQAEGDTTSEVTIAQQVAEYTRGAAEGVSAGVQSGGSAFDAVGKGLSGARSEDFNRIQTTIFDILASGGPSSAACWFCGSCWPGSPPGFPPRPATAAGFARRRRCASLWQLTF